MISKGFNFPKLNCIVVVDADFSGMGYDLRTTEKNIQLYHQLSGRAGRFSSNSLIIYQTLSPENKTLNNLIKNNTEKLLTRKYCLRILRLLIICLQKEHKSKLCPTPTSHPGSPLFLQQYQKTTTRLWVQPEKD